MTARVILGVVLALATAGSAAERTATEIAGSVTARRDGAVQISFEPRAGVRPAVGDAVAFTTRIDGIEVDAGRGEVVEVGSGSVWVRVSLGRPGLGHDAVIRATGRSERPQSTVRPGRPPASREAASGPEYIDLPETLGALPFASNPRLPGVVAHGGRRLLRPASGWRQVTGDAMRRMVWRTEEGPFTEGSHFRQLSVAVYGSGTDEMFIDILWYPPGSGRGLCTPEVNRGGSGQIGIISQRSDVRVIFKPSAFMVALKTQPDPTLLHIFAQGIFEQLEPFANPCRP